MSTGQLSSFLIHSKSMRVYVYMCTYVFIYLAPALGRALPRFLGTGGQEVNKERKESSGKPHTPLLREK